MQVQKSPELSLYFEVFHSNVSSEPGSSLILVFGMQQDSVPQ